MPDRHLPVRPNLEQLKHQAKDLLRELRAAAPDMKLAEAQHALARSYGVPSWPRLVHACRLIDAIWDDDLDTVARLTTRHPRLILENSRGVAHDNWGPPMSYAANIGRDRIIQYLHSHGATDHAHALDRAALQGRIGTAKMLHELMGRPRPADDSLSGPAYTLSASGTRFLLELGARLRDDAGNRIAPVHVVLESDSRKPAEKHQILEMYVEHGFELPDTAPMAVHRGRIDLLERLLRRDPRMLSRTYTDAEIFPPALGSERPRVLPALGSPLDGGTLLHMAVEYNELEIVGWLLEQGMDVNIRAATGGDGFGGHTALHGAVVSYPAFWDPQIKEIAQVLLAHGADPGLRASIRHEVGWGEQGVRVYHNVTPVEYGEQFIEPRFVSQAAIGMILRAHPTV